MRYFLPMMILLSSYSFTQANEYDDLAIKAMESVLPKPFQLAKQTNDVDELAKKAMCVGCDGKCVNCPDCTECNKIKPVSISKTTEIKTDTPIKLAPVNTTQITYYQESQPVQYYQTYPQYYQSQSFQSYQNQGRFRMFGRMSGGCAGGSCR